MCSPVSSHGVLLFEISKSWAVEFMTHVLNYHELSEPLKFDHLFHKGSGIKSHQCRCVSAPPQIGLVAVAKLQHCSEHSRFPAQWKFKIIQNGILSLESSWVFKSCWLCSILRRIQGFLHPTSPWKSFAAPTRWGLSFDPSLHPQLSQFGQCRLWMHGIHERSRVNACL